jgi:hypothetical protein
MSDKLTFPVNEEDISRLVERDVLSPIHVSSLEHLGINQKEFLDTYSSFFEELAWDPYDPRRLRVEFLKQNFPDETDEIQVLFKPYYLGEIHLDKFGQWINRLTKKQVETLEVIQPWRRRSVAQFLIMNDGYKLKITREPVEQFAQEVAGNDYRSLPRVFEESPKEHVENELFYEWMRQVFFITKKVRPEAKGVRMVAHFMSVKARPKKPGDNSPEGAHEDGADYIVSALVVNLKNVKGGESQIIEQIEDGSKEIIFSHRLLEGEFIFQGDSKDEIIHGTDLWHHVTPFTLDDETKGEGWRDIIGFDINVVL